MINLFIRKPKIIIVISLVLILMGCSKKITPPKKEPKISITIKSTNTPKIMPSPKKENKDPGWRYPLKDQYRTGVYKTPNFLKVNLKEGLKLIKTIKGKQFLIADLDGKGYPEWVVSDKKNIIIFDKDGKKIITHKFPKKPSFFIEEINENSPGYEIIGACNNGKGQSTIFVISSIKKILKKIPFDVNEEYINPKWAGDLDNDGKKEIVALLDSGPGKHRRGLWVFNYESGEEKWHFEIGPRPNELIVDDVNEDGKKEIILTTKASHYKNKANGYSDSQASVICLKNDGRVLWNSKLGTWELKPKYADLDNNGKPELIIFRNQAKFGGNATVFSLNPKSGFVKSRYDGKGDDSCLEGVIADMDRDKRIEVFATFGDKEKILRKMDNNLREIRTLPRPEIAYTAGDLGGNNTFEIVTGDYYGPYFHIYDKNFNPLWSSKIPKGNVKGAMICDIDDDKINELIIQSQSTFYIYGVREQKVVSNGDDEKTKQVIVPKQYDEKITVINKTPHEILVVRCKSFTKEKNKDLTQFGPIKTGENFTGVIKVNSQSLITVEAVQVVKGKTITSKKIEIQLNPKQILPPITLTLDYIKLKKTIIDKKSPQKKTKEQDKDDKKENKTEDKDKKIETEHKEEIEYVPLWQSIKWEPLPQIKLHQ